MSNQGNLKSFYIRNQAIKNSLGGKQEKICGKIFHVVLNSHQNLSSPLSLMAYFALAQKRSMEEKKANRKFSE